MLASPSLTVCVLLLIPMAAEAQSYSIPDAKTFLSGKNWTGLLEYSKKWTAAQPANASGWYYLGDAYAMGFKNYTNAAHSYERAVAINDHWADAWNSLGCSYALAGEFPKAVGALQHAVASAPEQAAYWMNLEAAEFEAGNREAAKETLNRGAELAGPYAVANDWYRFANAFFKLGEPDRAIQLYNKATAINRSLAEAYNNRGAVEQEQGEWRSALEDYQSAATLGDELGAKNAVELQTSIATLRQQHQVSAGVGSSNTGKRNARVLAYMKEHPGERHILPDFVFGADGP